MATPRTGRPRGRPEGYKKPWRTDGDRHPIGMASGLWHVVDIETLTAIKLAILCHYHDPLRIAAHLAPRRMNLRPKILRRIEADWRLDVFKEFPDDDAPDLHGTYLKAEAKRVIRQWQRWHLDREFEAWRANMAIVWAAVLCANQTATMTGITLVDEGNTITTLKRDIATRCSWIGENIYANSILVPLIDQAFRLNS